MTDEYYLQLPRQQLFYRLISFSMTVMACGDQEWWGFPRNTNVLLAINKEGLLLFTPLCSVSQIVYLYIHFNELPLTTIGTISCVLPVGFIINIKLITARTKSYKEVMIKFMREYHLFNFKDGDEYIKKTQIKIERYVRYACRIFLTIVIVDPFLWVIIPIMNNIKRKDLVLNKTVPLQTSVYLWMPFDYSYNYNNWILIHLLSIYLLYAASAIIFIMDSITYTVVLYLVGHIKILKHKIVSQKWEGLNQKEVKEGLVGILKYHSFVKRVFKDVQSAFGPNVGAIYLLNLIVDSLLMYQLMMVEKTNAILYALMFFFYMSTLILMSLVLEEIRKQSDDLSLAVYDIPWENMSVSNQKIVLLMLAQAQPPLVFKATGGIITGVRPMVSIIKTTFSYYVMLKSTVE